MKNKGNAQFISTSDLAKMLGISRISVFKKIKQGRISALKIGRSYRIATKDIPEIIGRSLSANARAEIDKAVVKTVRDYGDTLRLLGRE